jgi:glycosyltransferase involved in cell wall biosynthesis
MIKILGLFPLTGNGGIASWTKKYLSTFPDENYIIFPVSNSPKPRSNNNILSRIFTGCGALFSILNEVKRTIQTQEIDILHTTSSGSIGSFRDICVAKICKKYHVKSILHCRYGCITEDIRSKGLVGILLRKSMSLFDQIWVLDSRSYNTLRNIPSFSSKVFLTPNSIEVDVPIENSHKEYKKIAFIGNLLPTKGLYELVKACTQTDVQLDIIGPGSADVIENVKKLAGDFLDKKIFVHGKLPNNEAVKFMQNVDILALPTYYPWEAFPISILEAMSLTKMVISCPRAAIKDMLTDLQGSTCGMLVKPKSDIAIVNAIKWLQTHKSDADDMCLRAYEKVYHSYRREVVYELYRTNYKKLLSND